MGSAGRPSRYAGNVPALPRHAPPSQQVLSSGPDGEPVYTPLWAKTREDERAAFERFMDLAAAVRARNPAAHVYHFAPYEPAALKPPGGGSQPRQAHVVGGATKKSLTPARRRELAGWFQATFQVSCVRACRLAPFKSRGLVSKESSAGSDGAAPPYPRARARAAPLRVLAHLGLAAP